MPPGIYAEASGAGVGAPSAGLKKMKGISMPMAGAGLATGAKPAFGGTAPPAAPGPRQNPTTMNTYGGQTQQTDQMGRVITQGPMPGHTFPGFSIGADGNVTTTPQSSGWTQIEDPDQIRRSRDLADEQTRLARTPTAAPPAAGPGPGIDINELPGLLDKFKPDQVPREGPMAAPPREVGKGPEDRTAAESAAFARAAERISAVGRGNSAGLRNMMTRRGISGSGIEGRLQADAKNQTAGELGEVIRDQAIEGLRREQQIDDRDLAAGIQQRGQDIGVGTTNYTGGVQQRGQDLQQADWKINALPSLLALMRLKSGAQ